MVTHFRRLGGMSLFVAHTLLKFSFVVNLFSLSTLIQCPAGSVQILLMALLWDTFRISTLLVHHDYTLARAYTGFVILCSGVGGSNDENFKAGVGI
jgi:hypothetical protein